MAKKAIKNTEIGKEKEKLNKTKAKKQIRKNKKLVIIISIILFLLFLFAVYRIWLNIHFIIKDDIILSLEPQEKSLSIHYGETPNISFSVSIENSFVCNAYCSYEFRDVSAETIQDKGVFTSRGIGKSFDRGYQLSVDRIGSGQKIYLFEVQCNNIRTWYCPTNENPRKRSAFVTLNYDISEYENFLKSTLRENITKLADELSSVDVEMQKLNSRFFGLGFNINLNEIENEKEILNNEYNIIVIEFKNLERVWSEQDYLLLYDIFNKSYNRYRALNISQRIFAANSKVSSILERHNSLVGDINEIEEAIFFLSRTQEKSIDDTMHLINRTRELKLLVQENTFSNYTSLENEIQSIKISLEKFEKNPQRVFMESHLKGHYFLALEKRKLCDIKGICLEKTDFPLEMNRSLTIDNNRIDALCSSFGSIKDTYEKENNRSDELLKNYNLTDIESIIENAKSKKTALAKKSIFEDIKKIDISSESEMLDFLINISSMDLNISEGIDYGNFSESEILSLIKLNFSDDTADYYGTYCRINQTPEILEYYQNRAKLSKVADKQVGNFSSRIEIMLTENYPICCVFGVCKRCCTKEECKEDPSLYPVLFLHGHSMNKGNSPDYSLDAFNKIQAKLQEDGYVAAGTITPVSDYSEIKQGEWGLLSRPISVKGSYYLVSYYNLSGYSIATQKSENIETYALRLRELIDILKFRTGKDKVVIMAHSMGGLVARSYMQIFSDSSVDKLILIAVPNKGISGQVSSYCPVLGEKKECEDMSENSIFIKKLNDPLKTPQTARVYNIIGTGCDMGLKTGDGVVTKENAELDYAENYYINGTCSGIKLLHTEILDIGKYPELYGIISSVLKD
ncbi:alpha/beta fold hydrolase [Candidatus Woesearchaeota archaeon]|nr:alpha/beta fold hydrolase [Candidatus Woesearchaeota archaeon]